MVKRFECLRHRTVSVKNIKQVKNSKQQQQQAGPFLPEVQERNPLHITGKHQAHHYKNSEQCSVQPFHYWNLKAVVHKCYQQPIFKECPQPKQPL